MKDNTKQFAYKIGVSFNNAGLLIQAFTHRSYINENKATHQEHNERLEFLGDAVLELVVTDFLFKKYPEKPEGELTALRSALVNTQSLSQAAERLSMNDYLFLSRGEAKDTGRARQFILANTFEAVIGALYTDQGYSVAEQFIHTYLLPEIDDIVKNKLWQDAKSRFQELAQEKASITPRYELLSEEGPDHDKCFTVGVFLDDAGIAEGSGKSKQEAEQEAAAHALLKKGWA